MDDILQWFSLKSIPGIGNHLFKRLIERFGSERNPRIRLWIMRLAGKIGGSEFSSFLVEQVREGDPMLRSEAVRSLLRARFQAKGGDELKILRKAVRTYFEHGAWLKVRLDELEPAPGFSAPVFPRASRFSMVDGPE